VETYLREEIVQEQILRETDRGSQPSFASPSKPIRRTFLWQKRF
jgi:hypothetical protein